MQNGASQAGAGVDTALADSPFFPDDTSCCISGLRLFMRIDMTPQRKATEESEEGRGVKGSEGTFRKTQFHSLPPLVPSRFSQAGFELAT